MRIQFSHPDGRRRASTVGLASIEQSEIALDLPASIAEEAATHLLNFIADYLLASGRTISSGETMRYGWSTLRFDQSPPDPTLVISELADPFSTNIDHYVPGAARAITIIAEQDAVVQRNAVVMAGHHPHRSETAVVCARVVPGVPVRVLVFDRFATQELDDSGWFIGCGDATHNHNDASELFRVHLVRVAELDPRIVYYLALPEGTRVVFERRRVIVFAPGVQAGRVDEGAV